MVCVAEMSIRKAQPVAGTKTIGRLLRCVTSFCAVLVLVYGQTVDSRSRPSADEQVPGAIIPSAGSYNLEWRHHFPRTAGIVPTGTSDDNGSLWLITIPGPGGDAITKINPDGQLIADYSPVLPLNLGEWVSYLAPAASGHSVGLLASLTSGGRDQTFEGAFFLPIGADGLGVPVRIAQRGPQFSTMTGAGADEFIAAGDQEPLTLIRLDSNGKTLWRRAFSPQLVLPTISAGASGTVFVLSQGGTYILLQLLDSSGRVVRSKKISAKQGTVVADPGGGCSLLFSTRYGGEDNTVFLLTLDQTLHQLSQVETPLVGRSGRNYQLISSPHGHLVIGESPDPKPRQLVFNRTNRLAEFDRSGSLLWQQSISALVPPLLVPFRSGFYLVRELFDVKGMDIEKYVY